MITITPIAWRIDNPPVPDAENIRIEKKAEHHFMVLYRDGSALNHHGGWTDKSLVKYYRKSCQFITLDDAVKAIQQNLKACFGIEP